MKPIVAIVGRPNVGKSTLFNRITKTQDALVDDLPGVTRDRNYGDGEWNGLAFTVVDTGGFLSDDADPFAGQIQFQLQAAIFSSKSFICAARTLAKSTSSTRPFASAIICRTSWASGPFGCLARKPSPNSVTVGT